jgi:hypothetical protein
VTDEAKTLDRLAGIVRASFTTKVGLMSFDARVLFVAKALYDEGARFVEEDDAGAPMPADVVTVDVKMTPDELERVSDTLATAAAGLPAPVQEKPGFPAYDLHVWNEGDPEPSGRPAVVCADGTTALWDTEHEGWSRQRVTHHPVPEGAAKGSVGAVTVGPLGMDWDELLIGYGPVREATEHEARLVVEHWPSTEDRAS